MKSDLISLQMKVKLWKMDQNIFIPVEDENSSEQLTSELKSTTADAESSGKNPIEVEQIKTDATDDKTDVPVVPKVQLTVEPTENISLINIDDVVNSVTEDIQNSLVAQSEVAEAFEERNPAETSDSKLSWLPRILLLPSFYLNLYS